MSGIVLKYSLGFRELGDDGLVEEHLINYEIHIKLDLYHNLSDIILYFFIMVHCIIVCKEII